MFCPNCGNECSEKALFCPKCGEPFTVPAKETIEKTHASLFAFFLGGLGIHDFVLGRPGRGVGKIALTICGSFLILPILPLMIWIGADLFHIMKGTYPIVGKSFAGEDSVSKALFILYLIASVLGLGVIFLIFSMFFGLFLTDPASF